MICCKAYSRGAEIRQFAIVLHISPAKTNRDHLNLLLGAHAIWFAGTLCIPDRVKQVLEYGTHPTCRNASATKP